MEIDRQIIGREHCSVDQVQLILFSGRHYDPTIPNRFLDRIYRTVFECLSMLIINNREDTTMFKMSCIPSKTVIW